MSVDIIGSIVDGVVIKLMDYGAIVRLQGGKTGLVHISEIAEEYVRDVKDFFREQQPVRVKVLGINSKDRYELSTKDIEQPEKENPRAVNKQRKRQDRAPEPVYLGPEVTTEIPETVTSYPFEDRVARFLKESQEHLLDLKRNIDAKQGIRRR